MSYTKPDGNIIFSYKKDDLFKSVFLLSSYRARNIRTEEGKSLLDELALTEDERDAFEEKLIEGADIVIGRMEKLVSDTDYHANTDTDISFTIKDRQAYNENVVKMIDRAIKEILVKSVMVGWSQLTGKVDDEKKYQIDVIAAERALNNRSFQLRKMKMV
jgi:hypothetical protein